MFCDLLERFNDRVRFLSRQVEFDHVLAVQRIVSMLIITIFSKRRTLRLCWLAEVHFTKIKIVVEPGHHLGRQLVVQLHLCVELLVADRCFPVVIDELW